MPKTSFPGIMSLVFGLSLFAFTAGSTQAQQFSENFDGVTPPLLPTGWVATNASGPPPLWVTSNSGLPAPPADSPPNAAFVDDPLTVSDKRLDTPLIGIVCSARLTFRHNFGFQELAGGLGLDGGVVEISINGGPFTDIITAGGSFVPGTQAYNSTISSGFSNPLAGRQAFSGSSGGFVTTGINLPPAAVGQTIRLRFRMGSDSTFTFGEPPGQEQGWRVDNVEISSCVDVFQVNYFAGANGARPDQTVRITNPGTASGVAATAVTYDLCANIYVFRNDQQLAECCSCKVTPNGLRTLSVDFDLANNPLTPGAIGEGVIKIVSSLAAVYANGATGCAPATAASGYTPVAALRAWGTHNQDVSGGLQGSAINQVTETHFLDAALSFAELNELQSNCRFINSQGSGHGICSCGRGD